MKCQNCGKNDVNFYYSSNINGNVAETHLCSECAAKSGYDMGRLFDSRDFFDGRGFFDDQDFFDGVFPLFSGVNRFMQAPMRMLNAIPFTIQPWLGVSAQGLPVQKAPAQSGECECGGSCEKPAPDATAANVDEEMEKRREINVLREQMRLAAEKDDFEKAIELREKLKQLEA